MLDWFTDVDLLRTDLGWIGEAPDWTASASKKYGRELSQERFDFQFYLQTKKERPWSIQRKGRQDLHSLSC
jgi:hypothetical protein